MSIPAFRAGFPWSRSEEERLMWLFERSRSLLDMAQESKRTGGAIIARLQAMKLITRNDQYRRYYKQNGEVFTDDRMIQNVNEIMSGKKEYEPTKHDTATAFDAEPVPKTEIKPEGELFMSLINAQAAVSTVTVEQRGESVTATYIFGKPADQVDDDTIYNHIAELENKMENLGRIKNQPMTLKAKLKAVQAEINALVKVVDDRNQPAAS